jgi:hypothetical protein
VSASVCPFALFLQNQFSCPFKNVENQKLLYSRNISSFDSFKNKKVNSATIGKNYCHFCTANLKRFWQNFDKRLKIKDEKEKFSNSSDRNRTKYIYIKKFSSNKFTCLWKRKVEISVRRTNGLPCRLKDQLDLSNERSENIKGGKAERTKQGEQ